MVISRVFQKSGVGSSAAAGSKKRPPPSLNAMSEVSSRSSISLPPLLETSTVSESCSYDGGAATGKEHVSCFSTTPTITDFNRNTLLEPPPCLNPLAHDTSSSFSSYLPRHSLGVSAFPSLRSLQDNLQLPFFLSAAAPPPPVHGGADQMHGYGNVGQWPAPENQKGGGTEFECMWTY